MLFKRDIKYLKQLALKYLLFSEANRFVPSGAFENELMFPFCFPENLKKNFD